MDEPKSPRKKSSDEEIAELRSRISQNRAADTFNAPPPKVPTTKPTQATVSRQGFAGILGGDVSLPAARLVVETPPLRGSYSAEPDPVAYEAPVPEAQWQEEMAAPADHYVYGSYDEQPNNEQFYGQPPVPYGAPLMSPEASHAANTAFNQLADSLMNRALGERSVEEMTRELLRTMLKNWLDENLPGLVERLVREEIERVARRGR
jgi:cell pole-organizing protein PopZ